MTHRPALHRSMSLADALDVARRLGCTIERGHHGGEIRLSHRYQRRRKVIHGERKDAPHGLVSWLRQVEETGKLMEQVERAVAEARAKVADALLEDAR